MKKQKQQYTQTQIIERYGLSPRIINKYFPEPELKKNTVYRNAAPIKLWDVDTVEKLVQSPEILREIKRLNEKRKKKKSAKNYLTLFDIEGLRQQAEEMDREFILHIGPTNSGKTYTAMEALKKCNSGLYLGPLRLLALEMFETLNSQGFPCDLLTGEEYIETPGACFTASTIELCNFSEEYDIAVIDEAQMIADLDRGDRWTKAIYLVNAKQVHICLAPEATEIVERILDSFHAEYTIENHERLAPLEYTHFMKSLDEVCPGDALIVFSRKAVLAVAAELNSKHIPASVIYGALPPQSRREEVRRFTSGETKVVVATDAIGMGISIPIKRIVFCETEKFDGTEVRELRYEEIKQIAGRAGRFGIYDKGEVSSMNNSKLIKNALTSTIPQIEKITLPFPEEALQSEYSIRRLLTEWQRLPTIPGFERVDMSEPIYLYNELGEWVDRVDKDLLYKMINCPVDVKNDQLILYWYKCCVAIIQNISLPEPDENELTLESCELKYKEFDIRHQLLRQIHIEEDRMEEKTALCNKINEFLKKNKDTYLKRCRICKKILPPTSTYGLCEKCYRSQYMDDDWV